MGLLLFVGCFLITLGPPISIFLLAVAPNANLVVLMILSGFIWVLSIGSASLVWNILPPLQDSPGSSLVVAVFLQEVFRYGYYAICSAAERRVSALTSQKLFCPNSFDAVLASGLGFGTATVLVMFGRGLEETVSPGTVYTDMCRGMSYYLSSSLLYLFIFFLNIFLMVIATEGYKRKSWGGIGGAFALHLAGALATLFGQQDNGCVVTMPLLAAVTGGAGLWAARLVWVGLLHPMQRPPRVRPS
mmetsp:Transcript_64386/g.134359  ORF Transcript_64386/g.134359 Transcript_64386/m.134359 type:complete len:245 (+) Transcript_64386:173-907(+)